MRTLLPYVVYFLLVAWGLYRSLRLAREGEGRTRVTSVAFLAALGLGVLAISEPRRLFEDFAEAYYAGGAAVLAGQSIESLFSKGVFGFVNLPILAYVFVPLAVFPVKIAGALFAGAGLVAAAITYVLLIRNVRLGPRAKAILLLAFLANGPLMNSLREGNTSHFALLALTVALIELRRGRDLNAGLLIGFAALFKLPLLLFGAYFVLRRRFYAALGGALVLGGMGLLSLAIFGLGPHVTWYTEFVGSAGKNPVAAFNVQSFSALMARLVRGEGLCDWTGQPLPAFARSLASGLSLSLYIGSLAVCTRGTLWGRGSNQRTSRDNAPERVEPSEPANPVAVRVLDLEFMVVLMLACTTSPLAWSHYYVWCLLPIAFLLERSAEAFHTPTSRGVAWVAGVAVCLPVVWPFCAVPGWFSGFYAVLVTHYLFGGIALLVFLLRERWLGQPS